MVQVHPGPPRIGGVAQLGERLPCTQEVIGSIPFTSTSLSPHPKRGAGLSVYKGGVKFEAPITGGIWFFDNLDKRIDLRSNISIRAFWCLCQLFCG
jgi:hypothetical protein